MQITKHCQPGHKNMTTLHCLIVVVSVLSVGLHTTEHAIQLMNQTDIHRVQTM